MIIEFLGVSGVGKTHIATMYKEQLEQAGHIVVWDTYKLYKNYGWFHRNLRKLVPAAFYLVSHPHWAARVSAQCCTMHLKDRVTIFFNAAYLKTVLLSAALDENIHLFDEGAIQLLWAMKLRNHEPVQERDIVFIERTFGLPDKLLVISAEADTIEARIRSRGEYVRILDTLHLRDAIVKMQDTQAQIVSALAERLEIHVVENNENASQVIDLSHTLVETGK